MAFHFAALLAPVPLLVTAGVGTAAYLAYKKGLVSKPSGAGKVVAKAVAIQKVAEASKTTPHPTLGFDPGMTSLDVSLVNHALQTATNPDGLFQLAGDLMNKGQVASAQAVTAKAQAIDAAKVSGLSDDDIFHAMMTAGTTKPVTYTPVAVATTPAGPTYARDASMDLAMLNQHLADASKAYADATLHASPLATQAAIANLPTIHTPGMALQDAVAAVQGSYLLQPFGPAQQESNQGLRPQFFVGAWGLTPNG